MPSKRSKSKDRERKRIAREKMSEVEMENERDKAKERMRKLRNICSNRKKDEHKGNDIEEDKGEGEDWYAKVKAQSKLAMKEIRERQTSEEREVENCNARSEKFQREEIC